MTSAIAAAAAATATPAGMRQQCAVAVQTQPNQQAGMRQQCAVQPSPVTVLPSLCCSLKDGRFDNDDLRAKRYRKEMAGLLE